MLTRALLCAMDLCEEPINTRILFPTLDLKIITVLEASRQFNCSYNKIMIIHNGGTAKAVYTLNA
mgnify:FL=1